MLLSHLLNEKGNEIYCVKPTDSVDTASRILAEKNIGALLVQDENAKTLGILSERDIIRGMVPHGSDLNGVAVSELMSTGLVSCSPSDTLNKAMEVVTENRIRHLPIFEGDKLCGMLSIVDLVKYRTLEVQAEADAMRQYISS